MSYVFSMQNKVKSLFALLIVTVPAQAHDVARSLSAKKLRFTSGFGLTLGAGVTTGTTSGKNGAATTLSGIQGFDKTYPTSLTVISIGRPNTFLDFTSPRTTKNSAGFACVGGFLAQHVSSFGYTIGCRWLFGRSGQTSTLQYNSGPLFMQHNNPRGSAVLNSSLWISAQDTQNFRLKDLWYTAIIADLGYTTGCMQFYLGPGVAFHRQKLSLVNSANKATASLSKTVTAPMFALGTRYAINKLASIGIEWQRHIGGKKTWNNIANIVPENMPCFGAPTTNMKNNFFLIVVNYVFKAK